MSEDRSFAVTVVAAASAFAVSAAALLVSIVGVKSSMEESDQRIAEQMKNVELLQQSVRQEIGAYTENVKAHNRMMIKKIEKFERDLCRAEIVFGGYQDKTCDENVEKDQLIAMPAP